MTLNTKILLSLSLFALSGPVLASTCEDIKTLLLTNVTVTDAELVSAGDYTPRGRGATVTLPSYCRIATVLSPSSDSHIEMEIWLPDASWNGKFLAVGNGGWAGSISFGAMATGLRAGYAVASNDTGHKGGSAAFALGHPEKVVDFGYRAMHEMAILSKAIIRVYYERGPELSYYNGCSTGGRQGLMEAQRYPRDFDAIIAGAPVYNQTELHASQLYKMISIIENESLFLPKDKVQLLSEAVLAACEVTDGVEDGFLNNPLACGFDPESLLCEGTGTSACLTPGQVESVRIAYAPVTTSTGDQVYPGHAMGFELGWRMPAPGSIPPALPGDTFRYIAHQDPDWEWQTFDLDADTRLALERAEAIAAVDLDLSEFKARGGKLLLYHGWNDPGPSPLNTINYYSGVLETMGPDQSNWLRLFMMPGMGHCRGGIGPDQADFLSTLELWRESNIVPEQITSSRIRDGRVDMTRPLCPYPEVATWSGEGSTNDAANFACKRP